MIRRLLPLIGVLAALSISTSAKATPDGLNVIGYAISDFPPSRDISELTPCGQETAPFINIVFEYDPIGNCPTDGFLAHYTGSIIIPPHDTVEFWIASDDGGTMKIGLEEFGTWQDQGCSATESGPLDLPSNTPINIDGWFYENGGGTCWMLAWNLDGQGWQIIQPDAFTRQATPETTTTSTSTTTTTTTTSTTTTTTTTIAKPATTTTATTYPAALATTIAPTSTIQATTSTIIASTSTAPTPTSTRAPAPPQTTTTSDPSTTTLPNPTTPEETIDLEVLQLLTEAEELPPAELIEAVTDLIDAGLNSAEAETLATSRAIIENITPDQATEIFAAIDESALTPEQGAAIVAAVQDATSEVRAAFEQELNVYGGATDTYVPLGSRVPVKTRRIIIITTGLLVAFPPSTRKTIR
jgi:hypothetical protein